MQLNNVTIDDRDKIKKYLSAEYIESSEMTFMTMYIWRKAFNIKYAIVNDCIVFQLQDEGSPLNVRYPVGDGDKKAAVDEIIKHYDGKPVFYGLTKAQAELLPKQFKTAKMLDYGDYVYNVSDLINLSGKKYHSKKNHLNVFKKEYDYEYCAMDSKNALECISAYENWFSNPGNDEFLDYEKEAISDILNNFDLLGFSGGVLYADGKICAFTVSEQLNKDTVVIHIEKADTDYKGSYTAINQMHLENRWSEMKYVNREEDIGIEGLRKAKQSYHPCKMIDKYKARID